VSGNTPKGLEKAGHNGKIPFYKVSDMNTIGNEIFMKKASINLTDEEINFLKIKIFPSGTVIFPKRGGAILTNKKRVLFYNSSFDLNIMGVIPPSIIDGTFLFYWFQKLDLATLYDGSNVPQINNKNIEPLDFILPPLPEQKRIAAILNEQITSVEKLSKHIEEQLTTINILPAALLKRAFEGGL